MGQLLHGKASTTYAIRKAIQESKESIQKLASRYNINHQTVIKWRKRENVLDIKPGPKNQGSTILTKEEESIIIAFRKHTLFGLDDCLYSLKEIIPNLTRSSLRRCLQRHGISKLPHLQKPKKQTKQFKKYTAGYIHINITQMCTQEGKLYFFVGIDRTTKFCYAKLYKDKTKTSSLDFLKNIIKYMPYALNKILTDNGLQFMHHSYHKGEIEEKTNINLNGLNYQKPTKVHEFTELCNKHGIEHRLTKVYHPWTNGQVERINRTIKEAAVKKYFYKDHKISQNHLEAFLNVYNYVKPLKTLKGNTPYQESFLYLNSIKDKCKINPIHLSLGPNIYGNNSANLSE
ncbi:MAG: IS481 family transposase [Bacteroidetes bacterium]|nr:IS481 family transposase [Bacteroidota bacterium]